MSLMIQTLARRYLQHRRRLGYSLQRYDRLLADFARFCDQRAPRQAISAARAVEWSAQGDSGPAYRAMRLAVVRNFAVYCASVDSRTEVPQKGLLGRAPVRTRPHIFTGGEIRLLLRRARSLPAKLSPLRPHTYETIIGLLACTGMRPAEALQLRRCDFDATNGTVLIPAVKTSPQRILPLHPSTVTALQRYLDYRLQLCPAGEYFFAGAFGRRLSRTAFSLTMRHLLRGLRSNGGRRNVRPYDLRHTFATRLVTKWSQEEFPLDHRLLRLSSYLGHAYFSHTWWYVSGQSAALRTAARQLAVFRHQPALPCTPTSPT
jgi:integrase